MVMKIRQVKKATRTQKNPKAKSMDRLSLENPVALDFSSTMKPRPPKVKRKEEARPSMMYCPLTRYCMKATGRGCPDSSVVELEEIGQRRLRHKGRTMVEVYGRTQLREAPQ